MKNLTYLILLLFAGITYAQNIVFDGTIFKNKLLQSSTSNSIAKDVNGMSIQIDVDLNGEISYVEASAVYQLDVNSSSIVNLVGIEHFISLTKIDFSQNSVSSVTLSSLINLQTIVANHNNLTTIDLSALTNLQSTDVSNNMLQTIYAKNGNNLDTLNFDGGSNTNVLSYICIDDSQVNTIASQLPGGSTCVVNSYCTPTPGGNYTTISGIIVFDTLGDGIDANDPRFPNIKVECMIGSEVIQTISDSNGLYVFYTQQTSGSFSIVPVIEDNTAFVIPASFMGTLGTNVAHDFALTSASTPVPDLEVVVNPVSSAISGMNSVYQVTYKNKGSKKVTGNVLLTYDNVNLTIVSCTDSNASIATSGQVSLNFSDLLPFETRSFNVTFAINSGYSSGNILNFNTFIIDNLGSTEPLTSTDNAFTYKQTVGSILSNTMKCLEGSSVESSQIGQYLHYNIHFVNPGNAVATNVVVKTVFDSAKYDLNSLQILNSSHPLDFKLNANKALFYLNNVTIGGPGGDGGILLKIKSNSSLTAGQTVSSNAEIFFDYGTNFNIANTTNSTATTTIESTTYQNLLSTSQNKIDESIVVYPNPAQLIIAIDSKNIINMVQIFDIYGRLIQVNLTDSDKISIDVSERLNGVYFLKITSNQGTKVERIVKE